MNLSPTFKVASAPVQLMLVDARDDDSVCVVESTTLPSVDSDDVTAHEFNDKIVDKFAFGHLASGMNVLSTNACVILSKGGTLSTGTTAVHV